MAEERQSPSLHDQAARAAARRATQELGRQALRAIGAALGAKAGVVVAAVAAALVLLVLFVLVIAAIVGGPAQSSMAVWPVAVATDPAGVYPASGWAISSRYGWRDAPDGSGPEFHDGIDLASPQGGCPFGYHCGAPAMFDGQVTYVGWDQAASGDPATSGGGEIVLASNGEDDHQTLYAHLEPYRLYVQLQGRIDDPYGRYDDERGYQPIGSGPLTPDLTNGGIEMTCQNDMPTFLPTRSGHGTVTFLYDRPASCMTTVVWGERGDGWRGWLPDEPGGQTGDRQRADLRWQTPITTGQRAGDVALRFRAHLVPPPPPPPTPAPTDAPAPTPAPVMAQPMSGAARAGQGATAQTAGLALAPTPAASGTGGQPRQCVALAGGWTRCVWAFADMPTERERAVAEPSQWLRGAATDEARHATQTREPEADAADLAMTPTPLAKDANVSHVLSTMHMGLQADMPTMVALARMPVSDGADLSCPLLVLVRLPDVAAPDPRLVAPAAASFAEVRAEILARTGVDALAVLADVLRAPAFTTSKPGVLATSWHKAGRAVDLNQGGPFVRVAEGRMFRLFVGAVDITAIFAAHGWQRIPVQGDTPEWWHYEYHPDDIAWTSAMRQVWDLPTLQRAFPEIAWASVGCTGGTGAGDATSPPDGGPRCALGAPGYHSSVETVAGCGPPIRAGDAVAQLDTLLGFVGLSGRTTGPHLHVGMQVRSYDGSYPFVDVCTPEWLDGRAPPDDAACFTEMADPLAFLPRAPGNVVSEETDPGGRVARQESGRPDSRMPTPIIPEGAPYQLPPPNYPGALVFTPLPNATPVGQYWSPYAEGGRYGGGSVGAWFCTHVWSGFPWCGQG